MSLSDYAHWNEDAQYMWWEEEGKHVEDEPDYDDDVDCRYDDEPVPHSSVEECIKVGDMSSKDGVLWRCDHCPEGDLETWSSSRTKTARSWRKLRRSFTLWVWHGHDTCATSQSVCTMEGVPLQGSPAVDLTDGAVSVEWGRSEAPSP